MGSQPSQPPGYELGFPIGSGGMATVSYGRRVAVGGFAHAVAIKQLHPHLAANPEVVSMFLDEARLAARVVHANVVTILDVVQQGDDVWAVMPYIEGESLSQLAEKTFRAGGRIPVGVAVAIVADLLAGLEAAHTATDDRGEALGIVHRDVSPQNVLVGVDGVARVLDFGVAKAHGRLVETRDGQVKGKLSYMAPEQLGGDANVSTDVYATAIVLWELLAGRRLFDGTTDFAVMGQVLAGAASPPSQYASVPPALDALVMRALTLDVRQRFTSAAALARDLASACQGAIATRTEVAAWVRDVAAKAMDDRRALAFEMARRLPGAAAVTVLDAVKAPESVRPFVSTMLMPRQPMTPGRRSRHRLWASAVAALGLMAMGANALVPSASAEIPKAKAASPAAAPPSVSAAEPIGGSAMDPIAVPATAPALSLSTARQAAKASLSKAPRPVVASKASAPLAPAAAPAPAPPAATAVAEECDPPFVVDASGLRRYKRSCIR